MKSIKDEVRRMKEGEGAKDDGEERHIYLGSDAVVPCQMKRE